MRESELRAWHEYSFKNSDLIEKSDQCGCFFCLTIFEATEVFDWMNERDGGKTARCPRCGIDSVIPSAAPVELTSTFLMEMKAFFFEGCDGKKA